MIDYSEIDQTKINNAGKVSETIKNKFNLSHIKLSLNMLNDDINIELNQSEATQDVLSALKKELGIINHSLYQIKHTPILSGSYIKSAKKQATVLYNFEKI